MRGASGKAVSRVLGHIWEERGQRGDGRTKNPPWPCEIPAPGISLRWEIHFSSHSEQHHKLMGVRPRSHDLEIGTLILRSKRFKTCAGIKDACLFSFGAINSHPLLGAHTIGHQNGFRSRSNMKRRP